MRSAFALRIFSGKNIYNFGIPERLRTLRYSIFTGGVVEENGSCRAAFCESAALGGIPPQSLLRKASSPKGTPYGNAGNFAATAKSRPLGEGGIAAGDDGRGKSPLAKKITISGSDGGQKPKISITACFSALKKVQNL